MSMFPIGAIPILLDFLTQLISQTCYSATARILVCFNSCSQEGQKQNLSQHLPVGANYPALITKCQCLFSGFN